MTVSIGKPTRKEIFSKHILHVSYDYSMATSQIRDIVWILKIKQYKHVSYFLRTYRTSREAY